jgi:hypothetical protein
MKELSARYLAWISDLDDMRRLIKVPGVLPPLRCVQGENGADGRIGDRGHMGVPRVEAGPGDDGSQLRGLLCALQGSDLGVAEQLKALE